jgi:hypothetical protein
MYIWKPRNWDPLSFLTSWNLVVGELHSVTCNTSDVDNCLRNDHVPLDLISNLGTCLSDDLLGIAFLLLLHTAQLKTCGTELHDWYVSKSREYCFPCNID